jgi:hypothetical protein
MIAVMAKNVLRRRIGAATSQRYRGGDRDLIRHSGKAQDCHHRFVWVSVRCFSAQLLGYVSHGGNESRGLLLRVGSIRQLAIRVFIISVGRVRDISIGPKEPDGTPHLLLRKALVSPSTFTNRSSTTFAFGSFTK